jgi:hypothetical protein
MKTITKDFLVETGTKIPVIIEEKNAPFPRTTLWRLRKAGQLPFYRIGRRIYYSPAHLQSLLKACEVGHSV